MIYIKSLSLRHEIPLIVEPIALYHAWIFQTQAKCQTLLTRNIICGDLCAPFYSTAHSYGHQYESAQHIPYDLHFIE